MKATIKNAKLLIGKHNGWGSFKHALMRALNIPANQYSDWDVPTKWKYVYLRAIGWSAKEASHQLKMQVKTS